VTILILWSAFGSVFALLLGYSRIPYAAAIDGYFFSPVCQVASYKKLSPGFASGSSAVVSIAAAFP